MTTPSATRSATAAPRSPSPTLPSPPPSSSLDAGPRAQKLASVFNEALLSTLRSCSYAHFSACFPTPARYNPALLESVYRQITGMLESRSRREYDEIMVERDVVRSLGELERLIKEAGERKDLSLSKSKGPDGRDQSEDATHIAPHLLPPQQLYLAHLTPFLTESQQKLEQEMAELADENAQLAKEIGGQRDEVGNVVDGLEKIIRDLESANTVMDGVLEDGGIAREAKETNAEIQARESRMHRNLAGH